MVDPDIDWDPAAQQPQENKDSELAIKNNLVTFEENCPKAN